MRRSSLKEYELPIAMITATLSNQNRDPKKQKKPFSYKDFLFYGDLDENLPSGRYGAAAIELAKRKKMPSWALFCFPQLRAAAEGFQPPDELAFIAEDAMILAPFQREGGWGGLLIARESASEKRRLFTKTNGEQLYLTVPYVETKVIARENIILT